MRSSRVVIRKLEAAGWAKGRKEGSHQMMIHPTEGRVVPVPDPKKDLGRGLLRSLEKQTGVKLI